MSRSELPGRCELCPLPEQPIVQGYGTPDGPTILGEAPTAIEVMRRQPFVGESGKILRATLKALGVDQDEIYVTNSVLCRTPQGAMPSVNQIHCCYFRLEEEIKLVKPTKILTVGSAALTSILKASKSAPITKWRGRGFWTYGLQKKPIYTVPTYHPAAVLRDPELFRDFANDIQKWLENDAPMAEPIIDELWCGTEREALKAIKVLIEVAEDNIISCDLETTGKNPYTDEIMTLGFGTLYRWEAGPKKDPDAGDGLAVIIPLRLLESPVLRQALRDLVTGDSFPGILGFQNMKFDWKFIDRIYEEFIRPKRAADSMLMSYALDERPASGRFLVHGLKAQARVRYDAGEYEINFDKFFKQSPEEQEAQKPQLYHYQSLDLYYTARLVYDLRKKVEAESPKLAKVVDELLMPGSLAFTEIELRGVQLDVPYLRKLKKKLEKEVAADLKHLQTLAAKEGFEDFNPLSAKQVSNLLYVRWKLPKPRKSFTDRKELSDLLKKIKDPMKADTVRKLIDFRLQTKVLQTYVNGLLDRMQEDERIRSNFSLMGTVTGRLSSSNPNIQNIPGRHGVLIRNAFIASPGYVFIEADFNQLELRVATALSNEEAWVKEFKSGRDVHKMVAAAMLKKSYDDVTEFERRIAKTVDFGILYGRGAKSLMEGQELKHLPEGTEWWNLEEAERFQREFMEMFPSIKKWMDETKSFAMTNHYVEALSGRRRRFPYIDRNAHEVRRQAGNMPIQSTASDICLMGLIDLHKELPDGAYVLFSVHDAIYLECEKPLLKRVMKQIESTMLGAVPKVLGFTPDVPFAVKIKTGDRWGDDAAGPAR